MTTLTEHYADYKWVKVKRYDGYDVNISCEENYANLQKYHEKETTFLISEIRKLAEMLDAIKAINTELLAACKAMADAGVAPEYPEAAFNAWDSALAMGECAIAKCEIT